MNILLLGSGGREHAFAWKMCQSKLCTKLYIAPGNAGTSGLGTNVDISILDFSAIRNFVLEKHIGMVVVGPEDPLVAGIHDFFLQDIELKEIPLIGPGSAGAILEGSKDFSKLFMLENNIPTASYQTFDINSLDKGLKFLETLKPPYVLKADGLAAGKGVVILNDLHKAKAELNEMLAGGKFGPASKKVVIEEYLTGIELSVFVLTDGKSYKILPEAKDYKRIGKGDTGPNTGGMGAISPVPFAGIDFMKKVENQIIIPTINGLINRNINYKGFIFFGLMKVSEDPYLIEYNVRMGDPETEVVIPRIKSDLVELFLATSNQCLHEVNLDVANNVATTIMLVSDGYPGEYKKGFEITGMDKTENCLLFHAGTKLSEGKVVTSGGRVMAITGIGNSIENALENSYLNAGKIQFNGKYFRDDIGMDILELKKEDRLFL